MQYFNFMKSTKLKPWNCSFASTTEESLVDETRVWSIMHFSIHVVLSEIHPSLIQTFIMRFFWVSSTFTSSTLIFSRPNLVSSDRWSLNRGIYKHKSQWRVFFRWSLNTGWPLIKGGLYSRFDCINIVWAIAFAFQNHWVIS